MSIQVGQNVVVRGKAIGRVEAVSPDAIVVVELGLEPGEESRFEIAPGSDVLRLAVDAEQAARLIDAATGPTAVDTRDPDERAIAYRRICKRGELDAQLRALVGIYRHPTPAYPERQYGEMLERIVCAELGLALGKSPKQVRARLRERGKGTPVPASALLPDRAREIEAAVLPKVYEHDAVGAFAIDGDLAFGEGHPEVTVNAWPGIWLAYVLGDMDAEEFQLVVMHRDHFHLLPEDVPLEGVGEVTVEGARVAIFDATLADDDDLASEVFSREGIVNQRCVAISTGGDGVFPVEVYRIGGRVAYASITLAESDAFEHQDWPEDEPRPTDEE